MSNQTNVDSMINDIHTIKKLGRDLIRKFEDSEDYLLLKESDLKVLKFNIRSLVSTSQTDVIMKLLKASAKRSGESEDKSNHW